MVKDDNLAWLHLYTFGVFLRQRFAGAGVLTQDISRLLAEVAAQRLIQVGEQGLNNRLQLLRRHFGIDHFHFLQEDGAFLSVKGWQRFELQIDRRFLRAEQGVKIDVGDPTQGDFARLLAPDSAGQVLQFDMGVGNAFQTNIFGEMVSLLQGWLISCSLTVYWVS